MSTSIPASSVSDIRLLVLDCDGVLTDGSIFIDDHGTQIRRFHVRDGFAIKAARSVGLEVAVISGKAVRAVTLRLNELGIQRISQGRTDKAQALAALAQNANVPLPQIAFLGDDLIDLPAMQTCGYSMAVADAVDEVKAAARYITTLPGGQGAVRQAIEHLLKSQGRWESIVQRYQSVIA